MREGNRSQAVERLRAAAAMLDGATHATDVEGDVLELLVVAVLLISGECYGDHALPGEPVLWATTDAVEKFVDCAEQE